jgi:hypothetical protein
VLVRVADQQDPCAGGLGMAGQFGEGGGVGEGGFVDDEQPAPGEGPALLGEDQFPCQVVGGDGAGGPGRLQ